MRFPRPLLGALTLAGYVATIYLANFLAQHFHVQPVGFGLTAPAGVYAVGAALVLRDLAREYAGRLPVAAAIVAGVGLSYWLSDPRLAAASAAAFALSEGLDFLVYEPLRKRGLAAAMVASNAVGMLADSLAFLLIAFGSLDYLWGQLLGKAWMTVLAVVFIAAAHRWRGSPAPAAEAAA